MKDYKYKCFDCNKDFSQAEIEDTLTYLCPDCGSAEKNKPLRGVLQIIHDYESIKKEISIEDFLKLTPGRIWDYPQLWPLNKKLNQNRLSRLAFTSTPVIKTKIGDNSFSVFDDTKNPTLSYKDRASLLTVLKAEELGINDIAAASTGNAASSLAGICAALGITSRVFVPKNIPQSKLLQIQTYGAEVYLVNGDYDAAFDLCLEIASSKNWYNRNTAYNPITIEGKKSSAYDMFIARKGNLPKTIIVPVGDGVIIAGLYKGLWELKQLGWISEMPRLIAAQAEGSDALVRYLETGKFEYKPAETIADSISAGAPRNLYLAAHAVKDTNGCAISIDDEQIISAQSKVAKNTGLLIEPSCAITYAAFEKMISDNDINENENCMLMFTGNGLKDPDAMKKSNETLFAKSSEVLKKELLNE